MASLPQDSFGSGELSPRYRGRFTTDLFQNSLSLSRNTIGLNEGGVSRRAGTEYLADAGSTGVFAPYSIRNAADVVFLFTDLRVQAFNSSGVSNGFDEVTPYTQADLDDLRWTQDPNGDKIYLIHPSYQPRFIDKGFTGLSKVDYNLTGPKLEEFARGFTLERGVDATPVGGLPTVNLNSGADYFRTSDVGSWFQLDVSTWYRVEQVNSGVNAQAFQAGAGLPANTATSNWNGPFELERSVAVSVTTPGSGAVNAIINITTTGAPFLASDVGKVVDIESGPAAPVLVQIVQFNSSSDVNVRVINVHGATTFATGIEIYELNDREIPGRASITPSATTGTINLIAGASTFDAQMAPNATEDGAIFFLNGGAARVTTFTGPTQVEAEVLIPLSSSTPTNLWSKGWSRSSGFPRAVTLHQNRLVLGGVEEFGNTVYMSETGKLESFRSGADDNSALRLPIATNSENGIQTFASQGANLLVLTRDAEVLIEGNPVTSTSLNAQVQSEFGSASPQALVVDNFIVFVGIGGDKIRSSAFRFADDLYRTSDVSEHADHFFDGKVVKKIEQVKRPEQLIFAVNTNNELYCLSFQPSNRVLHWSYFEGLKVHDVARFPNSTSSDTVWMLVERLVDGVTKFYIESFTIDDPPLDSQVKYTTPDLDVLGGLSHLEGETVQVFVGPDVADPSKQATYVGDRVVTGGEVTTSVRGATAAVGVGFTSKIRPQLLTLTVPGFGSNAGKYNQSNIGRFLVVNSLGGTLTSEEDLTKTDPFLDYQVTTAQTPFTGWVQTTFNVASREVLMTIEHNTPHRFELVATNIDHQENQSEGV